MTVRLRLGTFTSVNEEHFVETFTEIVAIRFLPTAESFPFFVLFDVSDDL